MDRAKKEITGRLGAKLMDGEGHYWVLEHDLPINDRPVWHPLNDGDVLTIFTDASRDSVRWRGTVDLDKGLYCIDYNSTHECGPPTISTFRTAVGVQRGMAKEWLDMFLWELPASVIPAPRFTTGAPI